MSGGPDISPLIATNELHQICEFWSVTLWAGYSNTGPLGWDLTGYFLLTDDALRSLGPCTEDEGRDAMSTWAYELRRAELERYTVAALRFRWSNSYDDQTPPRRKADLIDQIMQEEDYS